MFVFFIILLAFVLILVVQNIVIVPQQHQFVIETLGVYSGTWDAGLHVKIPFIQRVAKKVSLKEQVLDFPPQSVITKDNVSMQIDTVIYMRVFDSRRFSYGVEAPLMAIENLTATSLRNIIGSLTLDETLTSRDSINAQMQQAIDEATDPWGIKVNRVELKNIIPPKSIQEAMEKEMKAERERREVVTRADGEKTAAITKAEGERQAAVARAEGEKQAAILQAEGERMSREQEALGMKAIEAVVGADGLLKLRAMETLSMVADGKATKLIIPSELQGLVSTIATAADSVTKTEPKN